MSTSYFHLRAPITSLALDEGPVHDRLRVWQDHGLAGELVVRHGVGRQLALMFASTDDDDLHCALHLWYGGDTRGMVVNVNDPSLPDACVVVSEYGEVTNVGAVKVLAGQHR